MNTLPHTYIKTTAEGAMYCHQCGLHKDSPVHTQERSTLMQLPVKVLDYQMAQWRETAAIAEATGYTSAAKAFHACADDLSRILACATILTASGRNR